MPYEQELIKKVRARVAVDLANHSVKVIRSDGLYRHWRCQNGDSWNQRFDIVTWPGSLCYTGDMGDYLFQRTDDMVAFMRGSWKSFGYAAEKCVAEGRTKIREFRSEVMEELLEELVAERIAEIKRDGGDRDDLGRFIKIEEHEYIVELKEKIEDIESACSDNSSGDKAMEAIYESGLFDGGDLPDLEAFTYHFLWCLHAIGWLCERVDNAGNPIEQEQVVAAV